MAIVFELGASDALAEECTLLMDTQLSFIHVDTCAGKPGSVPGGRGGYLHGWAAGVGEQGDLWPSGAPMWSMPGKGAHVRMFAALMALTQAMLCLQNADVTMGATATARQSSLYRTEERAEMVLTMSAVDVVTVACSATELQGLSTASS